MNRIEKKFSDLKAEGRKGLVGYLTAGDPDFDTSYKDVTAAIEGGIDVLELGVPFSDPTADGPTIQEASQRALAGGMNVEGVLKMVRKIREDHDIPIVLFGYANPFFKYGYERVCEEALEAGADGMLVVDLPFEESGEMVEHMKPRGLEFIPLIAPTTPHDRAASVLSHAGGFVYYIMVTGVTGARQEVAGDIDSHVTDLRSCTELPIAVGFGVSNGEQAVKAAESADAVVVGSALIKAARSGKLAELVAEIRAALDAS
ncbi:tryptophan synthase subunit alpha [bacterium E08(2017)]|nr:tryptophan synthase subunit alpha [bacterium E08(2017)]